jgi:phosphoribosylformimino-5-aminoimidazole carboxamide ribotide isomerase
MGGKCVRLIRGKKDQAITYAKTPYEIAEEYESTGARLIHVIDLDGAFTGKMTNLSIISALAQRFPIQVGGGVRSEAAIKTLLGAGVEKVIASTLLLKDQQEAVRLKEKYFGKLIGSFDFKDRKLSYAGWTKKSKLKFKDVSKNLAEIVVTDTSRDGTFMGPNIELLSMVMKTCKAKVMAAGGVLEVEDLLELKQIGVSGAIVGRAFLDGKLKLRDGLLVGRAD